MNPNRMRMIDYYLGIPICFLLTVLSKLQRLLGLQAPQGHATPHNVLFIELAEMGSTVLAYPAMKRLKELYPTSNIHFLLFDHIRESVDVLDIIPRGNVFTIDSKSMYSLTRDTLKFLYRSRKKNIDTAITLEMFTRYGTILSYLSGARTRVGFYRYAQEGLYIGHLLSHNVIYNPHIHTSQVFLSLVNALGASQAQIPFTKYALDSKPLEGPKIESSQAEKERIWHILREKNSHVDQTKTIVVVNPNASKLISLRRWPLEYYAQLIQKLLDDHNVYVVLTGVQAEQPDTEFICQYVKSDRVLDMVGKTSLRELISLFNIGDVLISNDSGPAHFAALTNIHIVVFFGPESPLLYKPLSPNCTVLYTHYACSPCVSAFNQKLSPCTDNVCLTSMHPDRVYDVIRPILVAKLQGASCRSVSS